MLIFAAAVFTREIAVAAACVGRETTRAIIPPIDPVQMSKCHR